MANTDTDGEPVVASVRHYSALLRLRRAFIETQIPFGYRSALASIEQHLTDTTTRLIASPHHCLLVVEYPSGSDDTTAYVLGLRKVVPGLVGGRIASVEELFVAPHLRRAGVGVRLHAALVERMMGLGVDRFELQVLAGNEAAVIFWRSLGYKPYVHVLESVCSKVNAS